MNILNNTHKGCYPEVRYPVAANKNADPLCSLCCFYRFSKHKFGACHINSLLAATSFFYRYLNPYKQDVFLLIVSVFVFDKKKHVSQRYNQGYGKIVIFR